MAVRTKLTIINAALTRLGWNTTTLGSGRPEVLALEQNYDEIVRSAFEMNQFPFGKGIQILTSRSDGDFGFDDAYLYPIDVLHVREVWLGDYKASDIDEEWELEVENRLIHLNAEERVVTLEYHKTGLEHTWSGTFTRAIQLKLEAVLKDFAEETREAQEKEAEAEHILTKSIVKSSKNRSPHRLFRPGRLRLGHYFAGRTRRR